MVVSLLLGAVALIGAGLFTTSLVASIAEPVSLILAGAAGIVLFAEILRNGYFENYFSSSEGEFIGAGLVGATGFYLVFVAAQGLITSLSPLAGIIVVGLGVAVFFLGPGIIFDLLDVLLGGD
jgi:hypothetical protein